MDLFKDSKAGMKIKYIGDTMAFGGSYSLVTAESTYLNPEDCPDKEKGKLMIIEFMNNGTPMYFVIDDLDQEEWALDSGD